MFAILNLITLMLAGVNAPLDVVQNKYGDVRVLREGTSVARLHFVLFTEGWNGRSPASGSVVNDHKSLAKIPANDAEVEVSTETKAEGAGVRVVVTATPNRDIRIESAHLQFTVPPALWAGSTAKLDGNSVPLVPNFNEVSLFNGSASSLTLEKAGLRLTLTADVKATLMVQDSRKWNGDFEFRMGIPAGTTTWRAGETKRYSVLLASNAPLTFYPSKPYIITAGKDWIPLKPEMDVVPGSALDFYKPDTKPAGSEGWLIVNKNGKFAFAKSAEKSRRFYGTNLVFSACFPEKPEAEKLALRLARMGFNTVRLHHYDADLTGGFNRESKTPSIQLDPPKLDKMDYLVYALKKRGIYVNIDLFTIRNIRCDEVIPGIVEIDEFKALLLLDDRARQNWLAFSKNLLNHVNPYTKLAWKNDPVLAWICPVNENTIGSSARALSAYSKALFQKKWEAQGGKGVWSATTSEGATWAIKLHIETYQWMKRQLRGIGVRALLTDVNGWYDMRGFAALRSQLDYVDNHNYWDHPQFLGSGWGVPSRGMSDGRMATAALGGGLQTTALTRYEGKPFTMTEFNFVAPNRFRAEGGLLMGAIAAAQDWDGLWRFAWSHSIEAIREPKPFDYFNAQSDPAMMAGDRAMVMLFLRGDLPPALPQTVVRVNPELQPETGYNDTSKDRILYTRFSSTTTPMTTIELYDKVFGHTYNLSPVMAYTEQGILTVVVGGTEGAYSGVGNIKIDRDMEVNFEGARAALWISSLDNVIIEDSKRMLITYVTDVQNTNIRYSGVDRDILESWGTLPYLVREGTAKVTLNVTKPAQITLYRLDLAGRRVAKLPVKITPKGVNFTLDIKGKNGASLYFEMVRK